MNMCKDFFKFSFYNSQDVSKLRNFMTIPEKNMKVIAKESSSPVLAYTH